MTTTQDTARHAAGPIELGVFTAETKGQANLPYSDGVQQQFKINPGLAAD